MGQQEDGSLLAPNVIRNFQVTRRGFSAAMAWNTKTVHFVMMSQNLRQGSSKCYAESISPFT